MRSCRGLFCALIMGVVPVLGFAGPVNINTADAETLAAELVGIGPALAAAIVTDREDNGAYANAEALMRVRGIGAHVLELNRENILVSDPPSSP